MRNISLKWTERSGRRLYTWAAEGRLHEQPKAAYLSGRRPRTQSEAAEGRRTQKAKIRTAGVWLLVSDIQMFQRETVNVIELGIGLCLLFSAGITQGFTVQLVLSSRHEEDQRISEHAGYYSSTISLISYFFANLVVAPFVLFFGPKWSLVIASAGYTIHMLGFLFWNPYFLYFSSTLQGVCAAVTWTATGVVVAQNSSEKTASRNSSIMWIIMMISMIIGGLFLLILFSCNINQKISVDLANKIYIGFACFCICAGIAFAMMKPSSEVNEKTETWKETKKSAKLMATSDMALLFPMFIFIGLESAIYLTMYPIAIVYTNRFPMNTNILMAWNSILVGIGQITAGLPLIILGEKALRRGVYALILCSCLAAFVSYVLVYLNIPGSASYKNTDNIAFINPSVSLALIAGFLLGVCDSFANVGLYSFISVRYAKESAQANAIMKFVAAIPNIAAVYAGSLLDLYWQLLVAFVAAVFGLITFVIVERRAQRLKEVEK